MIESPLLSKSIHKRFLVVALFPLLLIITFLALYTIDARRGDLSENLYQSGDITSDYLATISDLPLYSRNIKLLANTSAAAIRLPDVSGVAFIDRTEKLVLNSGDIPTAALGSSPDKKPLQLDNHVYFKKPVYLVGVEFSDYEEEATQVVDDELIGWVIVAIDQARLHQKQRQIIFTSLWLSLLGLIIAFVLTYYLSLGLIAPIQHLTAVIKKMARGNLSIRAQTGTRDELAILASGINQLAESITEGKQNLEYRINLATSQLQDTLESLQRKNRELELSRQEAETANQSKSDFLARMSHELRTPITSIQGFVHLLDVSVMSETDRHYCQIIDQSALQLLTLIDDILACSKLQSNTVELEQQPIDLAECIEQVSALFSPQAQHKGLCIAVDYAPDVLLHRVGDMIRLQQILSNLIANAIKFSEQGGVFISLKTNPAQAVIIEVLDTGIGISADAQGLLFNAFTQADTSISRHYGGTGLGLSIVKSLVDLMEGDIDLESREGRGSTFRITLPLPLSETQPNWKIRPCKVVIASCNEFTTLALRHALERFGVNDILVTDYDHLLNTTLHLEDSDRVIVCIPAPQGARDDLPKLMVQLRNATRAKLILTASQLNFYQQFNAKERAELNPVAFLSMPPPLSELHRSLNENGPSQDLIAIAPVNSQLLDGVNILIAEDNQFTSLLLDTLLSKMGAYCTLTNNGNEALAACQHDTFDLLLVDIHMPQKNGIDTLIALRRSNNPNARIPALALTADILQQEERALFDAGANGLQLKPLNENELLANICKLLSIRPPTDAPVPSSQEGDVSVNLFRQEVRDLLKKARQAVADDDLAELREQIHQLLGIAGVFKLATLEQLVRHLHEQIKAGSLTSVSALLDKIDREAEWIDL